MEESSSERVLCEALSHNGSCSIPRAVPSESRTLCWRILFVLAVTGVFLVASSGRTESFWSLGHAAAAIASLDMVVESDPIGSGRPLIGFK